MYKLDLEKAEEPEIKLPASVGLHKNQGNFKKSIHFCFIDYAKGFDCMGHNKLEILKEMGIPDHLTCLLKPVQVKKQQLKQDMQQWTDSKF